LNLFGARCLRVNLLGAYLRATDALRHALEEDLRAHNDVSIREWRLQVACDWIPHASVCLLGWAQENVGHTDLTPEDGLQYIEGGPLYHGPPAVCLQRWGFWIERFEALGKDESLGLSEEIRQVAVLAAQTMVAVEKRMANTLST